MIAHEIGHIVDELSGRLLIEGHERDLHAIYDVLNNPTGRALDLTSPASHGYTAAQAPRELWAEAVRAYMADPAWIKQNYPAIARASELGNLARNGQLRRWSFKVSRTVCDIDHTPVASRCAGVIGVRFAVGV